MSENTTTYLIGYRDERDCFWCTGEYLCKEKAYLAFESKKNDYKNFELIRVTKLHETLEMHLKTAINVTPKEIK